MPGTTLGKNGSVEPLPKVPLKYPLEDVNNSEVLIVFRPRELSATTQAADIDLTGKLVDLTKDGSPRSNADDGEATVEQPSDLNASSVKVATWSGKYDKPVYLYCPQQIQFQDGMAYNEFSLGFIGGQAEAAVQAGLNVNLAGLTADAVGGMVSGLISGITADVNTQAGAVAMQRVAQHSPFAGEKLAGAVSSASQTSIHPNLRTLFQGVNTRRFSFNFTLIAKSAREAQEIEDIVKYFREKMYPEAIAPIKAGGIRVPIGYRYPPRWMIQFKDEKTGQQPFQKIRDSYLVGMSTTYNGGDAVFHGDGKPTQVEISLTFMEDRPLNKADIQAGY